jgi:hypothetical protein
MLLQARQGKGLVEDPHDPQKTVFNNMMIERDKIQAKHMRIL